MKVTPVHSTCGCALVRAHRLSGQACSCPLCRDRQSLSSRAGFSEDGNKGCAHRVS